MLPGNSQILTCPFCGGEKQIMSLASGNTFGAEFWSDNKQIAPMLPEISYIQKCPHCGKYYIRGRQEVKYAKDSSSFDQGLLSFSEMKDAYKQLSDEGFENLEEEISVRMMMFHSFNDYYYRREEKKSVIISDFEQFVEQGKWLIENVITDTILKAEFYREIGEMDKAKELLENFTSDDEFLQEICQSIKVKIVTNDTKVFRIR